MRNNLEHVWSWQDYEYLVYDAKNVFNAYGHSNQKFWETK